MKLTRFQDIPMFTRSSSYCVDVNLTYIESQLRSMGQCSGLELDPDFQRAHVWDDKKRTAFVEFIFRGGRSALDIYFNCPTWQRQGSWKEEQPVVLVDGKQRLEAVRKFMRNELPAFGSYRREFTDNPRLHQFRLRFNVNDLDTRAEVLRWYLDINSGGVVHTDDELDKVRELLLIERGK